MNPSITFSTKEIEEKKPHPNTLKMAKHLFDVHGFLKIENLYRKEFISELAANYERDLHFNKEEMTLGSGTQVSHRRYIVPIPLKPPFSDPELYANPLLMPLMKEILGPQVILNSLGAITALPGSTDQHLHADYRALFEENTPLASTLPTFAVTFAVPLIDIDLLNGPTKIWGGSHRTPPIEQTMHSYNRHLLCGSIGCCYFWDYRTFHAGGSNHSDQMRSLLYMAYTRQWFQDLTNPDFLCMDEEAYQAIPSEHHSLFTKLCRPHKAIDLLRN